MAEIATTWGPVRIEISEGLVTRCTLPLLEVQPGVPFAVRSKPRDAAGRFIAAALSGRAAAPPPLRFPEGTAFQQRVWRAVARIPFGTTRTYGAIARAIGQPAACRAAANACGRNPLPLFIPCHRVVAADGSGGGYSAGRPWKQLLLRVEGRG